MSALHVRVVLALLALTSSALILTGCVEVPPQTGIVSSESGRRETRTPGGQLFAEHWDRDGVSLDEQSVGGIEHVVAYTDENDNDQHDSSEPVLATYAGNLGGRFDGPQDFRSSGQFTGHCGYTTYTIQLGDHEYRGQTFTVGLYVESEMEQRISPTLCALRLKVTSGDVPNERWIGATSGVHNGEYFVIPSESFLEPGDFALVLPVGDFYSAQSDRYDECRLSLFTLETGERTDNRELPDEVMALGEWSVLRINQD